MKLVLSLVCAVFAIQPAFAQGAKPTEESVRQLFELMHSSRLIDTYMAQIDGTVRASMQQAVAGQQLNPKQQKIMDDLGRNIVAVVKEELNWPSIEPMMIEVYRNTFTQHELDGMLTFYRSEAGQAVIAKLPTAMQQSMERMQGHVKTLTPRIVQLEKDTAAQLKAAGESQHTPVPPAPSPPSPPSPPKRP
ncbi:MAG TPA: DUF2059 domain-containing protein [Steroidobacteraceae bacterium]